MRRTSKKKSSTHSKEFYQKRYDRYLTQMKAIGAKPTLKTLNHFMIAYINQVSEYQEQGKYGSDIVGDLVVQDAYSLSYKAARRFASQYRADTGRDINIKEFRMMSYRERLDKYGDELTKFYEKLQKEGLSKREASKQVSFWWFGSK